MGKLAQRITDTRVLTLVRRYLEAGIMAAGVVMERHEGTCLVRLSANLEDARRMDSRRLRLLLVVQGKHGPTLYRVLQARGLSQLAAGAGRSALSSLVDDSRSPIASRRVSRVIRIHFSYSLSRLSVRCRTKRLR